MHTVTVQTGLQYTIEARCSDQSVEIQTIEYGRLTTVCRLTVGELQVAASQHERGAAALYRRMLAEVVIELEVARKRSVSACVGHDIASARTLPFGFRETGTRDENPMAHGGATTVESCRCGAERVRHESMGHAEIGEWH